MRMVLVGVSRYECRKVLVEVGQIELGLPRLMTPLRNVVPWISLVRRERGAVADDEQELLGTRARDIHATTITQKIRDHLIRKRENDNARLIALK